MCRQRGLLPNARLCQQYPLASPLGISSGQYQWGSSCTQTSTLKNLEVFLLTYSLDYKMLSSKAGTHSWYGNKASLDILMPLSAYQQPGHPTAVPAPHIMLKLAFESTMNGLSQTEHVCISTQEAHWSWAWCMLLMDSQLQGTCCCGTTCKHFECNSTAASNGKFHAPFRLRSNTTSRELQASLVVILSHWHFPMVFTQKRSM